ncbi:MAG: Eco57I restriction-modification methylase domain-containing protein, partial [Gemmatimonadota bacterium]|nr:Eco57I restriction-modification methylase domain-containing protein [Gemmatimonadota bacterium]
FHYQSHFADVFARGGFDVVVGNPPWLRSEEMPPEMRGRLAGRYRWWRTGGHGYANRPDLAVAFLERSLELAAPGGVLAMLVPAKIASAGYGVAARHALASATTLHAVVNLTDSIAAGFDATVYPLVIIAGKAPPPPRHSVRTTLAVAGGSRMKQAGLAGGGPWILARDRLRDVLTGLQADHPRLGDTFNCHLGLKTGANPIFLNPPESLESEVLRWAIRGRDVTAFRCAPTARLLWTHDEAGRVRQVLPPSCAAYLTRYLPALRERRDYIGGPPWVVFRVRAAISRHRVVWADLARQLVAAALTARHDPQCIPLNSCYVAATRSASEAERLTACLNSTWLRAAARLGAVPAAGGFARFNAQTIARLPLPTTVAADAALSALAQQGKAGSAVQEELDELVAKHLGLTSTAQNALRSVLGSTARHRR